MKGFDLKMLTPEKTVFEGQITHFSINTPNGRRGFLANHADMLSALEYGSISVTLINGEVKDFANGRGYVEVTKNTALVVCNMLVSSENLEEEKLAKEIEELQQKIKRQRSQTEYKMNRIALAQAMAKLNTLKK